MPEDDVSCSECHIDWFNIRIGEHQQCFCKLAEYHRVISNTLVDQGEGSGLAYPGIQILDHDNREEESGLGVFESFCGITDWLVGETTHLLDMTLAPFNPFLNHPLTKCIFDTV